MILSKHTCSAKYTVFPHFPHVGVPPPQVLGLPVGVPRIPPNAAPYRVPVPLDKVAVSGTWILPPVPFDPTDEIEFKELDLDIVRGVA